MKGETLKQGLIQAALGLILLAGSSVLLHLLDGQRTAIAHAIIFITHFVTTQLPQFLDKL